MINRSAALTENNAIKLKYLFPTDRTIESFYIYETFQYFLIIDQCQMSFE